MAAATIGEKPCPLARQHLASAWRLCAAPAVERAGPRQRQIDVVTRGEGNLVAMPNKPLRRAARAVTAADGPKPDVTHCLLSRGSEADPAVVASWRGINLS